VNKGGFLLDAERQEYNNKDDSYTCLFCESPLSFRKGSIKTMSKTFTTFECVSCFTHGNGKDDNINCISDNIDLEEPFDIQCTPQLTVTNEVIDGWQKCGLPDVYDYFLVDEGDRVKSGVEADKYGIVVSKKTQTPPGMLTYTKITVQWDDGQVSHPYPQQLIRLVNNDNNAVD
jgi:hypothetical protein